MALRYLLTLAAATATGILLVACVLGYKYYVLHDIHTDPRLGQLLKFQSAKIEGEATEASTIFVGDSSLGNALDARLFGDLTGTKAISLALTGTFHYSGIYAQLKQLAGRRNNVRNVFLIFAPDAPGAGMSADGFFFVSPMPVDVNLSFQTNRVLFKNYLQRMTDGVAALRTIRDLVGNSSYRDLPPDIYEKDYLVSHARIKLEDSGFRLPRDVQQSEFIRLIVHLCHKQGWNCAYAHGPIVEYALELLPDKGARYFSDVQHVFEDMGLPVATRITVVVPKQQRGDTIFHVHPDSRAVFTRHYVDLLSPYLATGQKASK
jgi:hypothetical protein